MVISNDYVGSFSSNRVPFSFQKFFSARYFDSKHNLCKPNLNFMFIPFIFQKKDICVKHQFKCYYMLIPDHSNNPFLKTPRHYI